MACGTNIPDITAARSLLITLGFDLMGPVETVNLSGGLIVPYPSPSSAAATRMGKANKRTDTKTEVRLRSELHRRGLRFRKDLLVRLDDLRVHVDIAFTRRRLAVFVDGCFWHGCPVHQNVPRTNSDYWIPKLAANAVRDRRVDAALISARWDVLRIWEHVPVSEAVDAVVTTYEGPPGMHPA